MPSPVLYVFNISHFCEKARWALDHFGITHEVRHVLVGTHRGIAKKLGARRGSVPFLHAGDQTIVGSGAIIDWCESQPQAAERSLAGPDPTLARSIEQRLDDVAGVHVRRFFYSYALTSNPASVRPAFTRGLPIWQQLLLTIGWSKVVQLMIKGMDLGKKQGAESCAILEQELTWLDSLLSDGRPYLTGGTWTRADLTAASLLAPLVDPVEHSMHQKVEFPPEVREATQAWADRPILQWVRRAYATHRLAKTHSARLGQ